MSEILSSAIIIGSLLFVVVVGYCCLAMASEWDEISEEQWREYTGESDEDEETSL